MTHKDDLARASDVAWHSRYERQMREEAREFHATSSSAAVELRVVDPGDGALVVVMTAVLSPTNTRRESCGLDAPHLATWLRVHLGTYCKTPRRPQ